jgi:hypothetical protein
MINIDLEELEKLVEIYKKAKENMKDSYELLRTKRAELEGWWLGIKADEVAERLNSLLIGDELNSPCTLYRSVYTLEQMHLRLEQLMNELAKEKSRCRNFSETLVSANIAFNEQLGASEAKQFMLDYDTTNQIIGNLSMLEQNIDYCALDWDECVSSIGIHERLEHTGYTPHVPAGEEILDELENAKFKISTFKDQLIQCSENTINAEELFISKTNEFISDFARSYTRELYIPGSEHWSKERLLYLFEKAPELYSEAEKKEYELIIEAYGGIEEDARNIIAKRYLLGMIGVSEQQIQNMEKYNYSLWDIYEFASAATTDIEKDYIFKIMDGNYLEAYKINPNDISEEIHIQTNIYTFNVLEVGDMEELEKLTLGIMGVSIDPKTGEITSLTSNEHTTEYLSRYAVYSEYLLELDKKNYYRFDLRTEEAREIIVSVTDKKCAAASYWNYLYMKNSNKDIQKTLVGENEKNAKVMGGLVSGIKYDPYRATLNYEYQFYGKDGNRIGASRGVILDVIFGSRSNAYSEIENLAELIEERKKLKEIYLKKATINIFEKVPIGKIASAIYEGDKGAVERVVFTEATKLLAEKYVAEIVDGALETHDIYMEYGEEQTNSNVQILQHYDTEKNMGMHSVGYAETRENGKSDIRETYRGNYSPESALTYNEYMTGGLRGIAEGSDLERLSEENIKHMDLSDNARAVIQGSYTNISTNVITSIENLTDAEYNQAVLGISSQVYIEAQKVVVDRLNYNESIVNEIRNNIINEQ